MAVRVRNSNRVGRVEDCHGGVVLAVLYRASTHTEVMMFVGLVRVGLVVMILLIALVGWRENRVRKRLWMRTRVENAKAKGMTLEEYNVWIESVS